MLVFYHLPLSINLNLCDMAKYGRKQWNQLSRVIANKSIQSIENVSSFVDNRTHVIAQAKLINDVQSNAASTVCQLMLWTWDGSKWVPADSTANHAIPKFKGKRKGETYEDGKTVAEKKVEVSPVAEKEYINTHNLKPRKVKQILKDAGIHETIRQTGSHATLKGDGKKVTFAGHGGSKPIKVGTLRAMLKQADVL